MTLQDREISAKNALNYGHYKKAIVHLKALIASEKRAEWIDWAQTAHLSLAEQLATHGNHQEVVNLFTSGHRLCDLSLQEPLYINALLKTNKHAEALNYFLELAQKDSLDKKSKSALSIIRSHFAAYAIAGESEIIERLPVDDPVVIDFDKAYQLLEAYCSADDEAVEQGLKSISFRSPYRDLRTIIAAAIKLDGVDVDSDVTFEMATKEKSREVLAHIAPDSAFFALAESLHLASQDRQDILVNFSSLNGITQQFILQINGWQKEQEKILKTLAKFPEEPDFSAVFRIADQYQKYLPDFFSSIAKIAHVQARARRNKVLSLKRYEQRFGKLNEVDSCHLDALYEKLAFEQELHQDEYYYFDLEEQFDDLEGAWQEYLDLLEESETKHDIALTKALVYRYFVEQRLSKTKPDNTTAYYLEKLLVFDPYDKESHIQLCRYYLDTNHSKELRSSLNHALEFFPDDLQVLLLAVEGAIASGAYKKAAKYAKEILHVDPINYKARSLLCNSHLSHARKQAKIKKWHLLEKELNEVEPWVGDQVAVKASIAVLKASMALAQKQNKQACEFLQQLQKIVKTPLDASMMIHLEANSINADAKKLHQLAKLKWKPAKNQGSDVLLSFVDMGDACFDQYHNDIVFNMIQVLSPALESINIEDLSLPEIEKIFDFWRHLKLSNILNILVDKAIKIHGDMPIFTYYRHVTKNYLSSKDYDELIEVIEQEKEQGNTKSVSRLISVLEKCGPPMRFGFEGFEEFDDFSEPNNNSFLNDVDENMSPEEIGDELLAMLPELIRRGATDDDIVGMMKDIVGATPLDITKYKKIVGTEGLKDMLIDFIENKTPPEIFIKRYENNNKDKDQGKSGKKKSFFQFNIFGDNGDNNE